MRCRAVLINVVCLVAGAAVMFLCMTPSGVVADCPGAPGKPCGNGDVNGDGNIDIADAIYLLSYLFGGGAAPVACASSSGGSLPATGQTVCYNTAGDVIACSSADWPGQDGFYRRGCSMEGRFVDNGDGTVTDLCTGLMWQQETAPETYNWQNALKYCEGLDLAGYTDWRLPNVRELRSIVDYGRWEPAIDPVFGAVALWYWSSSTSVAGPYDAWSVNFHWGYVHLGNPYKAKTYYVRAVRG